MGYVGYGSSSNTTLYLANDVGNINFMTDSGQVGTIVGNNLTMNGEITAYSDMRLKFKLKPIENSLEKVMQLTGYTYDKDKTRQAGLIAQEVQSVLPEAVKDGEYLSLNTASVSALHTNAIKELNDKINRLKTELYEITRRD
jgi:hypothetical protein